MKKRTILFLTLSFLIISSISVSIFISISKENKINKIRSSVVSYLMSIENFNEVPENIDIKYDKESKLYVAAIKFEDNTNIMHIFITPDLAIRK